MFNPILRFPKRPSNNIVFMQGKRHLGPQKKDWTVQPHLLTLHTFETTTFAVPNARIQQIQSPCQRMIGGTITSETHKMSQDP